MHNLSTSVLKKNLTEIHYWSGAQVKPDWCVKKNTPNRETHFFFFFQNRNETSLLARSWDSGSLWGQRDEQRCWEDFKSQNAVQKKSTKVHSLWSTANETRSSSCSGCFLETCSSLNGTHSERKEQECGWQSCRVFNCWNKSLKKW